MSGHSPEVSIVDAIQGIRRELTNAIAAGANEDLRFNVDSVEIEFQVEVSQNIEGQVGAKGGLQFGVISIGESSIEGGISRSRGTTHTVKLTLTPTTAHGGDVQISNPDVPNPEDID